QRTLDWLLAQQRADGSWDGGDALHAGNEVLGASNIRTTAFIAWALAHTGWADSAAGNAAAWLASNLPSVDDVYANALSLNALAKIDPNSSAASQLYSRVDSLKDDRGNGQASWPTDTPSWTGAGGDAAALETTGLVAYGLMQANAYPENVASAMRFIIANKDSVGTWYNTQATMNALRALSAAASPQGSDAIGTFTVALNGAPVATLELTADNGDVYHRIDLSDLVVTGDNIISLEMVGSGELTYQIKRRAYRQALPLPSTPELSLSVAYDRTSAVVGEPITATVIATNNQSGIRDQVMVRIGRAPGFAPRSEDLEQLQTNGKVSRYEVNDEYVTFYLMGLQPSESRQMVLRFTPTMAVDATAPASMIYAYYEPQLKTSLAPATFSIAAP
ncbi:MAG: hypothetical protein V3T05_05520, partial [Myxococcota bacterium]